MEPDSASAPPGGGIPAVSGFRAVLVCVLLAAAVFAAFGGSLRHGFVWDDTDLIFIDCVTSRPLDWHAIFHEPVDRLYRPLRTLTYILEFEAAGKNPAVYHFTSISLHAAVCVLVFLLVFRLSASLPVSMIAALLFGVHPVHAGTVAFISGGRADLLATTFTLLSLLLYLRSLDAGSGRLPYALSLASFALALAAKESSAVAPALVVCLALTRRGEKGIGREALRAGLFFALLAGYMYFRFVVVGAGGQSSGYHGGSLLKTMLTTSIVWASYVRDLIVPTKLCPVYAVVIEHHLSARVALAAVFLSLLAAASLIGLFRRQLWGVGLAWFFIALLPVSNLIPINSLKSDRFLYLPAIGMMLAVSDLAAWFVLRILLRGRERLAMSVLAALALAASAWFIALTRPAAATWESDEALWMRTTACAGRSWVAWVNLGGVHFRAGRADDAVGALKNAARFNPDNPLVYNNLADVYGSRGDYEQSLRCLERARELDPGNPEIYVKMGYALTKTGNKTEALRRLEEGLRVCPRDSKWEEPLERFIRQLTESREKTR